VSHVTTVDIEIRDLAALREACKRLGLEFVEDQKTYRWYNRHMGDYPVPEGFKPSDLGKCEHAIRNPSKPGAYEIGVVKRRDGRPGYTLIYDFYGSGGRGIEELAGKQCVNLRKSYATSVAKRQAQRQGFRVQEHQQADGKIRLRCVR
jgi:hypothetical protein